MNTQELEQQLQYGTKCKSYYSGKAFYQYHEAQRSGAKYLVRDASRPCYSKAYTTARRAVHKMLELAPVETWEVVS